MAGRVVQRLFPGLYGRLIWPVALIVLGLVLVVWAMRGLRSGNRT